MKLIRFLTTALLFVSLAAGSAFAQDDKAKKRMFHTIFCVIDRARVPDGEKIAERPEKKGDEHRCAAYRESENKKIGNQRCRT